MESEIFEPDWENCEYCYILYKEHDTGYTEYGCNIWDEVGCCGGNLNYGCPLAFKYAMEE